MAVSDGFRDFVVDQLGRVSRGIRTRPMFGGVGIYAGDDFFALLDDDRLYLKADDTNRPDFEEKGFGPFRPGGGGGEVMQYYELPADIIEETDELRGWVEKAVAVARSRRKAARKGRRRE